MAYGEYSTLDLPFKTAANLTAAIYTPVKVTADQSVAACAAGEAAIGFLQNKPNGSGVGDAGDGVEASVRLLGVTRVRAAGVIALGVPVAAAGANLVTAAASGDFPLGTALEAASAAGQVISVAINPSLVPLV